MNVALITHQFLKFLLLFSFWFLLSGNTDGLHLSLGLISVSLVLMLTFTRENSHSGLAQLMKRCRRFGRLFIYIPWLCYKILTAALHVSYLILHPALPINPSFFKHPSILKNDRNKVIFANSVTLTPGTITADIEGDIFYIHQLDDDSAGDIRNHSMEEMVVKMFGTDS